MSKSDVSCPIKRAPNKGDAADRPNCHTFFFPKSCADFVGR
jgi:hypothetical protein